MAVMANTSEMRALYNSPDVGSMDVLDDVGEGEADSV